MLRRHPNYIWDQLAEDRLWASLIVDGHHLPAEVDPAIVSRYNDIYVSGQRVDACTVRVLACASAKAPDFVRGPRGGSAVLATAEEAPGPLVPVLPTLPPPGPSEVSLDGLRDAKDPGIQYWGRASRLPSGEYQVLANIHGTLCSVAVRISFEPAVPVIGAPSGLQAKSSEPPPSSHGERGQQ